MRKLRTHPDPPRPAPPRSSHILRVWKFRRAHAPKPMHDGRWPLGPTLTHSNELCLTPSVVPVCVLTAYSLPCVAVFPLAVCPLAFDLHPSLPAAPTACSHASIPSALSNRCEASHRQITSEATRPPPPLTPSPPGCIQAAPTRHSACIVCMHRLHASSACIVCAVLPCMSLCSNSACAFCQTTCGP